MKFKHSILVVLILLLATLINTAPMYSSPGVETYKVHKWDVSDISLSIDIKSNNSKVRDDLNTLADYIEGIIGAFKGSDYRVFVGDITQDSENGRALWASGFLELRRDIAVTKNLFLTIASIADWMFGEEIPMNETLAEILAFDIPKRSVFPLPPISLKSEPLMRTRSSLGELLVPRLNMRIIDTPLNMLRSLVDTFTTPNLELSLDQMETLGSVYATPIYIDNFFPGMIIGDPDAIRAFGPKWEELSGDFNFLIGRLSIDSEYSEKGDEAIFSLKLEISIFLTPLIKVSFRAKYSLATGLLKELSLSASFSSAQIPYPIYTHKYGVIYLTVSGSIRFGMQYVESDNLEPWTDFGEPLAYKITDIIFSPELEQILSELGLLENISRLKDLRVEFIYKRNPTGLIAEYDTCVYRLNESTGEIVEVERFNSSIPMLMPGSIRVYPYKDILYGQLQLVGHLLTNVLPKGIKYLLVVAKAQGQKVPEFDMHGYYDVLESIYGHFAILANVTLSIKYTDVEPGHTPFVLNGYGGIWFVYKSTGYLVEAGFELDVKLQYDRDGDGSLANDDLKEYSVKLIINKVVSERIRARENWSVNWDELDSDPPSFSDKQAWSIVTPAKIAELAKMGLPVILVGLVVISLVLIISAVILIRRRKS